MGLLVATQPATELNTPMSTLSSMYALTLMCWSARRKDGDAELYTSMSTLFNACTDPYVLECEEKGWG